MNAESVPARPALLELAGAYQRWSRVQAAGLIRSIESLEHCAAHVELPQSPRWVLVADYGASAGHNSLLPIGAAVKTIRARIEPGRAILVAHTDVAADDYATLFATLDTDSHSYLRHDRAVFTAAVGRSVYGQILPTASVTLGWSSWAVHWLSRTPAPIPDHIQIGCSSDATARSVYARQAAADWIAFLAARGRELAPGGQLVVLTTARREDDDEVGYRPLLDGIIAELETLVADGIVRADEVARMVVPTVARTHDELVAPFAPKNLFAGLHLDEVEIFDSDDRFWQKYQKDSDATSFGNGWAAFARTSVAPTLAEFLDDRDDRASRFTDRLCDGLAARLAAGPLEFRVPLARLVLTKQSWPR